MASVLAKQTSLTGHLLVTNITKYLSTLPHPIEIVEELVAVCAVTSSLLNTLSSALHFFQPLTLSPKYSFVGPLCHDVCFAFKQLEEKVDEARRMKVFEPNDVGLVRLPRAAWVLVMGTEGKMKELRSRLYVEKYRVRVLIDAVCWEALKKLKRESGLNEKQEGELRALGRMLPLIAERLVGVQKDYVPRLRALQGLPAVEVEKKEEKKEEVVVVVQEKTPEPTTKSPEFFKKVEKPWSGKISIHSSSSTDSLASTCSSSSSMTIIDDSIEEMWVLRRNEAKKTIKRYNEFLGMRYWTSNSYTAPSYYVKPVPSNASEIKVVRQLCQKSFTESEYQTDLKKRILKLPEDAQWEIQRLTEDRDNACSNDHVKRSWRVVAFQQKPRRKISPESGRRWFNKNKQPLVEWVLVLRGETLDHKSRTIPSKHDDPWNPKPKPVQIARRVVNPCPPPPPAPMVPSGAVLRHVENRRVISTEEAEKKMEEIVSDLFKYEGSGKENDAAGT